MPIVVKKAIIDSGVCEDLLKDGSFIPEKSEELKVLLEKIKSQTSEEIPEKEVNVALDLKRIIYYVRSIFSSSIVISIDKTIKDKVNEKLIKEIFTKIIVFLEDPEKVTSCLKELDDNLGKKNNGSLKDIRPRFYYERKKLLFPGPPLEDYAPCKKHGALNELLLETETKNNINREGVAKFMGFVDSSTADEHVAKANLFREGVKFTFHGKDIHRLQFNALIYAMQNEKLDLRYDDGSKITAEDLLKIFVQVKFEETKFEVRVKRSLWELLLDNEFDDKGGDYCFGSSSPHSLNLMIMSFGEELGLPNLRNYLIDNHYKSIFKLSTRFCRDRDIDQTELDSFQLYQLVMLSMLPTFIYLKHDSLFFYESKISDESGEYESGILLKKEEEPTSPHHYESYESIKKYLEKVSEFLEKQPVPKIIPQASGLSKLKNIAKNTDTERLD